MSHSGPVRSTVGMAMVAVLVTCGVGHAQSESNSMNNPYHLVENWPQMPPSIKWGAVIGIIPDDQGNIWMLHRSEPPIIKFDQSGKVVKSFGQGTFVQAHGFCMDGDGNLWAGDSGPFADNPATRGKGFQFFKFNQEGKVLMTLGKAGVSKAGEDTFVAPTACIVAPNGDIIIADGHVPRGASTQQDGDRIVKFSKDGKFIGSWGRTGSGPSEFNGAHALALDSRGRLFVADRSNNRVQIFDKEMNFVDDWRHFGRPSGIAIFKDTLYVADSESNRTIPGPDGNVLRNPGWKRGIRIGSALDGSLLAFINGTSPEGIAGDANGNVYSGLTSQGSILHKYVKN